MFIGIIYFFVILVVISIGAIAGISGGVILRPVFDMIGYHNVTEIAFFSSVAIVTMTISSTLKQIAMGVKIDFKKVLALAAGAFTGGFVGQTVLSWLTIHWTDGTIQILQGAISIALLLFVLAFTRENVKTIELKGIAWYVIAGLGLGTVSTIVAIGGGPINVAAFILLFSIKLKEATVYSITTIFFAQAARLGTMVIEYGLYPFDLRLLFFILPAAILGGQIGGRLNVELREVTIRKVFQIVIIVTILTNIVNVINFSLSYL